MTLSNKIYYIYPFTPGPQDSIELRYSLRSFVKHVKDDYTIIITGDEKPNWLNINFKNIEFLKVFKIKNKAATIYNNVLKAIEKFNIEKFIKLSDDNIFLQNFECANIDQNPYIHSYMPNKKRPLRSEINQWQNKLWDTAEFAKSLNLPSINYVTHVPQCFYSNKLIECNKVFNISSGEHLFEVAYYNFFHKEIINKKDKLNDIKWGAWASKLEYTKLLPNYLFGNQDHKGLYFTLPVIKNLFQKKSKFEKYYDN